MGQNNSYLKINNDDIGKYIVIKMQVNNIGKADIVFNNGYKPNLIYCPLQIGYYSNSPTYNYKINLKPVGVFEKVCWHRDWYTSDIESVYDHDENAYFTDNEDDAKLMANELNGKLYLEEFNK